MQRHFRWRSVHALAWCSLNFRPFCLLFRTTHTASITVEECIAHCYVISSTVFVTHNMRHRTPNKANSPYTLTHCIQTAFVRLLVSLFSWMTKFRAVMLFNFYKKLIKKRNWFLIFKYTWSYWSLESFSWFKLSTAQD